MGIRLLKSPMMREVVLGEFRVLLRCDSRSLVVSGERQVFDCGGWYRFVISKEFPLLS